MASNSINRVYRTGIGGIERKMKDGLDIHDKHISEAFRDLNKLMEMAKEMSVLSRSISSKLRDKGADSISNDETVQFKSALLQLGIQNLQEDPVTRKKFTSDSKYYAQLARQIVQLIGSLVRDRGGQMALTDVFMAVNRARGFDLISPDDLLNACQQIESQGLGLRLMRYPSGLVVLVCHDYNQRVTDEQTLEAVKMSSFATPHQLSIQMEIPLSLARQRLLNCEKAGLLCRDESVQGLRFFPNRFLHPEW